MLLNANKEAEIKMTMTPFGLDVDAFRECYPALTEERISDEQIENLFGVVSAMLGDGEGNFPYPEATIQAILFSALCHLVTLSLNDSESPSRIASASEGSVSVSFENVTWQGEDASWWSLTRCGSLFWILTKKYRTGCKLYTSSNYHPWG